MRKISVLIMSFVYVLVLCAITCQAQGLKKKSDGKIQKTSPYQSAAIDVWRVEMDYVKVNKPQMVNGFLVGSGGGVMGTIGVKKALSNIDCDAFICTLVMSVTAGEKISAFVTEGRYALSMTNVKLGEFAFPFVAVVQSSSGEVFTTFPAILKAKIDIKAGSVLHSNGFSIETKRPIKTGDTVPVLVVGDNILSVEAVGKTADGSEAKPWFTAFREKP